MQHESIYILSAFENQMDWSKVERYTEELIQSDIDGIHPSDVFPPIKGYETTIDKTDLGSNFIWGDLDRMIEVTKEHLGKKVWKVTDGHHRAFAFARAYEQTKLLCFKWIETERDYATLTSQEEIENFNNSLTV